MKVKIWMTKQYDGDRLIFHIERQNGESDGIYTIDKIYRRQKQSILDSGRGYRGAIDDETDTELEERAIKTFNKHVDKAKADNRPSPEIIRSVEFE